MWNAPWEHSAILLTFIKPPFVFNSFVLSIFDWQLKTGFTVITYANKSLLNTHPHLSSKDGDLNGGYSLYLQPYFVYLSSG